jgi:ATP-dependent Clp protease ATP-binding subunit ClpB
MENLCIEGYDPVFGARPLKRLIQRNIVDLISNEIIKGTLHDGDKVKIEYDLASGKYSCEVVGSRAIDTEAEKLLEGLDLDFGD